MRRIAIFLVLGMGLGCSSKSADGSRVESAVPVADPDQPLVQNPDYASWKQFAIGTTIVRKSVSENKVTSTTSIETFRLAKASDSEVSIEVQNTTTRSDGSYHKVNDSDVFKYSKSFRLPNGMNAEDFQKPAINAKKTGQEVMDILGKKYATTVYKWVDQSEAGPFTATVWVSPEIPGRIVRQKLSFEKVDSITIVTIESITVPAAKP